jgi:hypothetical protein
MEHPHGGGHKGVWQEVEMEGSGNLLDGIWTLADKSKNTAARLYSLLTRAAQIFIFLVPFNFGSSCISSLDD